MLDLGALKLSVTLDSKKAKQELKDFSEATKDTKESLQDNLDDSTDKTGKKFDDLRDDVKKTADALKKDLADDAKNASKQLDNLEDAADDAGDSLKKDLTKKVDDAGDSLEDAEGSAKSFGEALKDDISRKLEDANPNLKYFSDLLKNAGVNMESLSGLATGIGAATIGISAISSLFGKIVDFATDEELTEVHTNITKLQTSYQNLTYDAGDASDTIKAFYRFLGDDDSATEAASNVSKLASSHEELEELIKACEGVYAQFGDSVPMESFTEAANETAKVGTVTGSFADILNWTSQELVENGIKLTNNSAAIVAFQEGIAAGESNEDAFNDALATCSSEAERQQFIIDYLGNEYSETADDFEIANQNLLDYNEAAYESQQQNSELANALKPVATGFTEFSNNLKSEFTEACSNAGLSIDDLSASCQTFASFLGGLGSILGEFGGMIVEGVSSLGDYWSNAKAFVQENDGDVIQMVKSLFSSNNEEVKKSSKVDLTSQGKSTTNTYNTGMKSGFNSVNSTMNAHKSSLKKNYKVSLTSEGSSTISSFQSGMSASWGTTENWVNQRVAWIKQQFASAAASASTTSSSTPGHRNGLAEVPYDGYIAELHKGEMVLTAAEANQYQKNIFNSSGGEKNYITVNNYSPKALDEAETARQYRKAQRQLQLGFN